jgi:RNA polymerase sigma-70 factor (ECF subfamily)
MKVETEYFTNTILPLKQKLFRKAYFITESEIEAEDVVQDVMMLLWNKKADWHRIENMEVYSLVLTKNAALDKVKKKGYHSHSIDETMIESVSPDLQPLEQLLQQEAQSLVMSLLKTLPESQQELIRLREIEELSYQEIAIKMNLTEAQVKVNLFRARQRIKELYLKIEQYGLK